MYKRQFTLLRQVGNVILQGTPEDIDTTALRDEILALDGVQAVHHFHVWSLTTEDNIGSVHVVSTNPDTRRDVQTLMEQKYHLHHVTVQVESPTECCDTAKACC